MKEKLTLFCHGTRHHMERFMEICLLLLLDQETSHGYTLAEQLNDFGFSKEELNMGSLYRTLRKMEKDSLVTSCWEEGKQGPKKRVYQITEAGKASLKNWIVLLKKRRKRISKLINYYEKRTIK
ncbi:MAG: helix-turn-helix transcriptional regulator [Atribacterota bacterium]|nr:helix-turn-helix transcriptional regulator [Atribacterota bacterium]